MAINGEDSESLIHKKHKTKNKNSSGKAVAFVLIGGLTFLYCIAELIAALSLGSLTLLSDGFHNLSDVVSLYIAYWAQSAAQRDLSKEMSYGWARTEILGGLTNGCFLLSLCLYVALEAIPRLIKTQKLADLAHEDGGYLFIGIAAVGLVLNILGTIVFAVVGISHGHSHSHGHGHGHGHGHNHKEPAALAPVTDPEHSHAPHVPHETELDHSHDHDHDHKKKDKSHKHSHSEIKEKKKKKDHSHSHGDHKHDAGHDDHIHDEEHSHGHEKEKKKKKKSKLDQMDMNTRAVFLHFLGDAISSLCVLGTGLVLHFFSHASWIVYLDPGASLLIVFIIITTTVPLVKRCSMILLQSVPSEVDLDAVSVKTSRVDGVISVHDLHVWQLVDGMIIASVHLMVEEGSDVGFIVYQVKQIFHSFGIHSSAIQPEFVKQKLNQENYCVQNCVEECEADWCCKKTADKKKDLLEDYSTFNDV